MKLCFILGTRPEIIKLYSLIKECELTGRDFLIIHTNQHYDEKMDKIFFQELEINYPKYNLNIGSGSHAVQTAKMMIEIEKVLVEEKPDVVIVQGDTNTVISGALVASKLGIKIAHVEAGLRSYDREMPEEINRIVTDHISDYLFCPTTKQQNILLSEGIDQKNIFVTGNTIVDAVYKGVKIADRKSTVLNNLGLENEKYFLLTCHRPSNTDNEDNFKAIISAVSDICETEKIKCIFPAHPRLKNKLEEVKSNNNFILTDPVGYLDMLKLQKNAKLIFTDSGGIQEESCILEKKCIILRKNTERPETLEVGGAVVLDEITAEDIKIKYNFLINKNVNWKNPFGDGLAYEKILNIL